MKITKSLLDHFLIDEISCEEIAKQLTDLGVEVEAVDHFHLPFSPVVAARIDKVEKHPNADKLGLVTLYDGTKELTLVCGDRSVTEGDLVPLVQEGATYRDDAGHITPFKPREIRGILSKGMLLTEQELNISEENEGVLRLDTSFTPGESVEKLLNDVVFDISLTPNLGHCQSALGIVRQLCASLNCSWKLPSFTLQESTQKADITLDIPSSDCLTYATRGIDQVEIKNSPIAVRHTLRLCGLRPINNIVDVTNVMMLLYGQPLHAFDLDHLQGNQISVEKKPLHDFLCLDDQKRSASSALVVQDQKGPIAIAGVIGGMDSSVTEKTKRILIEAAYFSPAAIRKSVKELRLKTESALRFEKGIDPEITLVALDHAAHLMHKLASGTITQKEVVQKKIAETTIPLNAKKAASFLGITLNRSEIASILQRLDCTVKATSEDKLSVTIPSYRFDLNDPIDLIEEIAKIYGLNAIEKKSPSFRINTFGHSPLYFLQKKIKKGLARQGLYEIITSDLISPKLAEQYQEPNLETVTTLYSKSEEHSALRSSLLPSHLYTIAHNLAHKKKDMGLFEISAVHHKKENAIEEDLVVGIALSGNKAPHHFSNPSKEWDFYDLKGIIENLFSLLHQPIHCMPSEHPFFHPYRQMEIKIDGKTLGLMGEVHPNYVSKQSIKQKVLFAQIELAPLVETLSTEVIMTPLPEYPSSERDLTITVSQTTPAQSILQQINEIASPLLEKVEVQDQYQSKDLGDKRNLTLRFTYRDLYKTLSYDEVEKEHTRITKTIASN